MHSEWQCRTCSERQGQPYRYPPHPDAYCLGCGQALTTRERGVETLRGLLAYLERTGLTLPGAAPPAREATSAEVDATTLSATEVARLLGTTRKGVYAKVARGQLPGAFRVGRTLRFRRTHLLGFLAGGRAPSSRRTTR